MYRTVGKRLIDLTVTILALTLLMPVLLVIAIMVRLKLGAPIFFRQRRPGLNGEPFTIIKFRTMTNQTDANGELLSDADRLTPFGQFLRRTSLDELPELLNVLQGDMSLVGPRPLLMEYLGLYSPEQMRRHEVRPGITGWAQVHGRNAISWEDKFAMDVWYVENVSLWLDVKIVLLTVWAVLRSKDINQPGHATADFFRGTPERSK